jgi:hypothetical protein
MSTTLNEAIKLVEEMEADELTAAPAAAALDDPVDSAMEPSEPPVSDSAVGADTEEDTALGLLRQMRDFLAQLATALAPEETPEAPEGKKSPVAKEPCPPNLLPTKKRRTRTRKKSFPTGGLLKSNPMTMS